MGTQPSNCQLEWYAIVELVEKALCFRRSTRKNPPFLIHQLSLFVEHILNSIPMSYSDEVVTGATGETEPHKDASLFWL